MIERFSILYMQQIPLTTVDDENNAEDNLEPVRWTMLQKIVMMLFNVKKLSC